MLQAALETRSVVSSIRQTTPPVSVVKLLRVGRVPGGYRKRHLRAGWLYMGVIKTKPALVDDQRRFQSV